MLLVVVVVDVTHLMDLLADLAAAADRAKLAICLPAQEGPEHLAKDTPVGMDFWEIPEERQPQMKAAAVAVLVDQQPMVVQVEELDLIVPSPDQLLDMLMAVVAVDGLMEEILAVQELDHLMA